MSQAGCQGAWQSPMLRVPVGNMLSHCTVQPAVVSGVSSELASEFLRAIFNHDHARTTTLLINCALLGQHEWCVAAGLDSEEGDTLASTSSCR